MIGTPDQKQRPSLDTICAIATPVGKGGIGVVKISGSNALALGRSVFYKKERVIHHASVGNTTPPSYIEFRPRHMYHGYILENASGRVVDEVLWVYMNGPHSYTGEDVVEIHSHSGPAVLETIFNLILQRGGRCAEPGEFTQRAFLNGRIDLTQAEGVMDLINAKSSSALNIAAKQVSGEFSRHIQNLRARVLDLITRIEAGIDFPDEVGPALGLDQKFAEIQREVLPGIERLIRQHEQGRVFREGFRLALVGRPNVGKSSLLNRLLGHDRAIVTDIPGTTRDVIHETVSINGAPIVLTDTAGIQPTDNPIEKIGIGKTKTQIAASDLILFVVDVRDGIGEEEIGWFDSVDRKRLLIVVNKVDLIDDSCEYKPPESFADLPLICISAKTAFGVEELWEAIKNLMFRGCALDLTDAIVPNFRQKVALQNALAELASASHAFRENIPLEMIAIDLQGCLTALGSVLGINVREDVLDCIFKEFCIGK
jgi:tRNA modification GTPase